MEYPIRKAEPGDVDTIYRFISELEETNFGKIIFEKIYFENIENPKYIYLVAETGTKVIGFISCHTQALLHHCGRVAEIQELFIDASYRGFKIGLILADAVEKAARKLQCISLEVTAQLKREQTHLFYEKHGFRFTHKKFVKQLE